MTVLFAYESEEIVTGYALVSGYFLIEASDIHKDRTRWVYEAALKLSESGRVDIQALIDELTRCGRLDEIGGPVYILDLYNRAQEPGAADLHANEVKRLAEKRRARNVASALVKAVDSGDYEPAQFIYKLDTIRRSIKESTNGHKRFSWKELLSMDLPDIEFIIPGILPVGAVILAGRPKIGKSWLALQLAVSVGCGGMFLGGKANKENVLYLCLEDRERRLRNRLKFHHIKDDAVIDFQTNWPILTSGGLDGLKREIEGGTKLIIIDTLSRAMGMNDQMDLAQMTWICGEIQSMASAAGICVLLVDHHRKSAGFEASPVDDVLGSTGKVATVDAIWGLYREKGKREATLSIIGRDLEDVDLALQWDREFYCWQSLGDAGAIRNNTLQARVIEAIQELSNLNEKPTTTRLAQHMDQNKGNVSRVLTELMNLGKIKRGEKEGRDVPYYLIK